jgi:hypothetical protein
MADRYAAWDECTPPGTGGTRPSVAYWSHRWAVGRAGSARSGEAPLTASWWAAGGASPGSGEVPRGNESRSSGRGESLGRTGRALDLDYVGTPLPERDELLEEGDRLVAFQHVTELELEVGGLAVREDEGWGPKDAELIAAFRPVLADPRQEGSVGGVALEPLKIEPGLLGGGGQGLPLAVVLAVLVLQPEERGVESTEGILALELGGYRRLEGGPTARAVRVGLLPELPLRTLRRIDLLQREVAPIDVERLAGLLFDPLQPDRRSVDERSAVVEVDVHRRVGVHGLCLLLSRGNLGEI